MQHNPSLEANTSWAIHEIPCVLWNPMVHSSVYKSPTLFSVQRQIYPVHDLLSYFLKIQFNIILPSTPKSSKRSPLKGFPCQSTLFISLFALTCHMAYPSHTPWFDYRSSTRSVIAADTPIHYSTEVNLIAIITCVKCYGVTECFLNFLWRNLVLLFL